MPRYTVSLVLILWSQFEWVKGESRSRVKRQSPLFKHPFLIESLPEGLTLADLSKGKSTDEQEDKTKIPIKRQKIVPSSRSFRRTDYDDEEGDDGDEHDKDFENNFIDVITPRPSSKDRPRPAFKPRPIQKQPVARAAEPAKPFGWPFLSDFNSDTSLSAILSSLEAREKKTTTTTPKPVVFGRDRGVKYSQVRNKILNRKATRLSFSRPEHSNELVSQNNKKPFRGSRKTKNYARIKSRPNRTVEFYTGEGEQESSTRPPPTRTAKPDAWRGNFIRPRGGRRRQKPPEEDEKEEVEEEKEGTEPKIEEDNDSEPPATTTAPVKRRRPQRRPPPDRRRTSVPAQNRSSQDESEPIPTTSARPVRRRTPVKRKPNPPQEQELQRPRRIRTPRPTVPVKDEPIDRIDGGNSIGGSETQTRPVTAIAPDTRTKEKPRLDWRLQNRNLRRLQPAASTRVESHFRQEDTRTVEGVEYERVRVSPQPKSPPASTPGKPRVNVRIFGRPPRGRIPSQTRASTTTGTNSVPNADFSFSSERTQQSRLRVRPPASNHGVKQSILQQLYGGRRPARAHTTEAPIEPPIEEEPLESPSHQGFTIKNPRTGNTKETVSVLEQPSRTFGNRNQVATTTETTTTSEATSTSRQPNPFQPGFPSDIIYDAYPTEEEIQEYYDEESPGETEPLKSNPEEALEVIEIIPPPVHVPKLCAGGQPC
ncbi:unnamed protein product [Darwinula stevensoni]|uniref:Uncharacterized protein n=1 Tax=Darwinula stevensoni TaxID=69355 RepID=A0A7R8XF08_9CRUS|nr:unnamed protein product [Darwinula stevensoni]CAG0888381.1 unnamed protein product [Darwinula stevensoni]